MRDLCTHVSEIVRLMCVCEGGVLVYIEVMFKERRLTSLQEVNQARPVVIQKQRVRPSHRTMGKKVDEASALAWCRAEARTWGQKILCPVRCVLVYITEMM
jgi:hypothetical protein